MEYVNLSSKVDKYIQLAYSFSMKLELFTQLSLTKAEAATFLAIWQYPDGISVLELSRSLNLPRPTIYSHLESLSLFGIVKKGIKEHTSLFYPEPKQTIQKIFDEKIDSLKSSKDLLMSSLVEGHTSSRFKPKFFVYEGSHAYEQVWNDILRTKEEAFWIWPIKNMLQTVSSAKLEEFHKERIARKLWMNVLWPEKSKVDIKKSPFLLSSDEKASLRRVRILPKGFDQDIGYGIYGNKVAFISSGTENYAFVIESKELSQTLKKQFEFFWKASKKYK